MNDSPADDRGELRIPINSDDDFLSARQRVRNLMDDHGFSKSAVTSVVTSVSELSRNILVYARTGFITAKIHEEEDRTTIAIRAEDSGPGIPDVQKALLDGYSTSGSLGLGLPGVRRLMDRFEIESQPNKGTVIKVEKWTYHRDRNRRTQQ